MASKRSETTISAMIKDYLKMKGYIVWRNNTGVWKTSEGNIVRNGVKGSPDIIGFTPQGHFIGVEVKRPGKKITYHQQQFAKKVRSTPHGIYIVATSVEDVQYKLFGFKNEQIPF